MRLRSAEPDAIVDINAIEDLNDAIEARDDCILIGALTTHAQLLDAPVIERLYPWLTQAVRDLGDVQVRNRGTALGNLCWADPRANLAVALLACGARIHVAESTETSAILQIDEFFAGFRRTQLGTRLATAIELPILSEANGAYLEFSRQRQDLALVNVCTVVARDFARVVVGGIDQTPVRIIALEQAMLEERAPLQHHAIHECLAALPLTPLHDHYGSPEYKLDVAATLLTRALSACRSKRS